MLTRNILLNRLLLLLCLYVVTLKAQSQNVLEGSKGNSSVDYNQYGGGVVTVNSADKKVQLGYINYRFVRRRIQGSKNQLENRTTRPYWYGFNVSGKAVNDYATIFSNGKISPATNLTLKFGYRLTEYNMNYNEPILDGITVKGAERAQCNNDDTACKAKIDRDVNTLLESLKASPELWVIGRGGYGVSKFNLYDPSRPFPAQFQPNMFDGFNGSVALNFWHPNLLRAKLILLAGLSVGIEQQNNLADLSEVTAEDVTTIDNPPNTTRTFKKQNIGFAGGYQTSTSIPVNFDFYIKPHKLENAAFSFYGRLNSFKPVGRERQTPTNLGIGLFLLNENWLAHPVGGITFELQDVFKTLPNSSSAFKDRLVINILARVNIFKLRGE